MVCSCQILCLCFNYGTYKILCICIISVLTGSPDEATEPPEKLEAGTILLQKQSQEETNSSDDRQQAELNLPSQGHNYNICISYKVSLCVDVSFTLKTFCRTQRFYITYVVKCVQHLSPGEGYRYNYYKP